MSSVTEAKPAASEQPARAPRGKGRVLVLKLLLLAITSLLCVAFLELAVRWMLPQYAPARRIHFQMTSFGVAMGVPSQTVRQRTPKGDYDLPIRFNALGFRDPRNLRESTDSDWFALGDSFTFGWGVPEEQRYSDLLEAHLKTNGIGSRVFNIAVPENMIGYQRLLAFAERNGARVKHLVVGICMENDLRDYSNGYSAHERDAADLERAPTKQQLRVYVKQHSALYMAASYALHSIPACRRLMEKAGIARDVQMQSGRNEWNPKALESSRDQLLKVIGGREAVILIIPARRLWHGDNKETEDRVHQAFVGLVREAGLRVVDMRPVFEKAGDPLSYYFKTDPHWSPQGHAVAAAELARVIRDSQSVQK